MADSDTPEDVVMPFGKFIGKTLGDILAAEPSYLDRLAGTEIRSQQLKDAVTEMCDKYAPEIEKALKSRRDDDDDDD